MKKLITLSIQFTALFFISIVSLQASDIKKGNWEMTYTTTMTGVPMAIQIPVKTEAQCIDSNEFIPESSEDGECSHSSRRASSDKIVWDISCKSNGMKGHGEMVFNDTSMDGLMEMSVDMMGQKMAMKVVITGKYVGACK